MITRNLPPHHAFISQLFGMHAGVGHTVVTLISKHTLSLHKTTQVRPQGCQVRENGCRQLLKLVVAKVQRAATK
jgi:hypothetical protein